MPIDAMDLVEIFLIYLTLYLLFRFMQGTIAAAIVLDAARRGRVGRAVRLLQWLTLATLAIDTGLGLVSAQVPPTPISLLTRLALPLGILLLARPAAVGPAPGAPAAASAPGEVLA